MQIDVTPIRDKDGNIPKIAEYEFEEPVWVDCGQNTHYRILECPDSMELGCIEFDEPLDRAFIDKEGMIHAWFECIPGTFYLNVGRGTKFISITPDRYAVYFEYLMQ
jgi:hypothetical protein